MRPVASFGDSVVTNSVPAASSRTTEVTCERLALRLTWNRRTVLPGTTEEALIGREKPADHGATVEKPSSALSETLGSPKLFGLATVMLRVRSVEPRNAKLIGEGTEPVEGLKFADITLVSVVGGGAVVPPDGPSELPPQPASRADDRVSARTRRDFMCEFPPRDLEQKV